jgi:hypothetical protein
MAIKHYYSIYLAHANGMAELLEDKSDRLTRKLHDKGV